MRKLPQYRGECEGSPRPCPHTSCRYHLAADRPDVPINALKDTCALDVADREGATLDEVGEILGISRERVRQIEASALAKIRRKIHFAQIFAGDGHYQDPLSLFFDVTFRSIADENDF